MAGVGVFEWEDVFLGEVGQKCTREDQERCGVKSNQWVGSKVSMMFKLSEGLNWGS